MKLIKPGQGQVGWSHEFKCSGKGNGDGGCGAFLLVELPDLFRTFRSFCGETETYVTFQCSECQTHTDLPGFMYPPKIAALPTLAEWATKQRMHAHYK